MRIYSFVDVFLLILPHFFCYIPGVMMISNLFLPSQTFRPTFSQRKRTDFLVNFHKIKCDFSTPQKISQISVFFSFFPPMPQFFKLHLPILFVSITYFYIYFILFQKPFFAIFFTHFLPIPPFIISRNIIPENIPRNITSARSKKEELHYTISKKELSLAAQLLCL